MEKGYSFYKENPKDKVFWVDNPEEIGEFLFSFDKKKVYNLFADYPNKLSEEEKQIFDRENPYWVDFFQDRIFPKSVLECARENGFEHIGHVKQYRENDLMDHEIYIAFHNTPDDEDSLFILAKGGIARPATIQELEIVLNATFPPCI